MSQDVKVQRELEFNGSANNSRNIAGNPNPKRIFREYNFTELALDNTNLYTPYLDTTSTVALGSGGVLLTTAATDTKTCTQTQGGIWWYPAKNPTVEFKFQLDVITTVAIFAGFSDAVSEASGLLPHGIATATHTATASDSAGFLYDTRQTAAYFNVVSSKAAGAAKAFTQLASTYIPVAATDLTLRVSLKTTSGVTAASYFWNGVQVGYKNTACTYTTPLLPFFGIRNNDAVAHVATLRYVRAWQDA
jgi:hypothetical protein